MKRRLTLILIALAVLGLAVGGWVAQGVRWMLGYALAPRFAGAAQLGIALLPKP